ncbi:hypothetical protein AGLY_004837 [Aphis glycines]|uniref:Uncharacterized protein n=1 Tax=Aphis glycines TaxID=307491 RepID=A0A6G0TV02_APHGL|nr:hypothetical protein AGLY_004837 [Aphis glycines]
MYKCVCIKYVHCNRSTALDYWSDTFFEEIPHDCLPGETIDDKYYSISFETKFSQQKEEKIFSISYFGRKKLQCKKHFIRKTKIILSITTYINDDDNVIMSFYAILVRVSGGGVRFGRFTPLVVHSLHVLQQTLQVDTVLGGYVDDLVVGQTALELGQVVAGPVHVHLVGDDQLRPVEHRGREAPDLVPEHVHVRPRLGRGQVDDQQQRGAPLHVPQERYAQAAVPVRVLDEPREVGHGHRLLVVVLDHAHVRLERGERVRGHLGPGPRNGPEQRALARVRESQQPEIGDAAQLQRVPEHLARAAQFGHLGRLFRVRGKVPIAVAARPAPGRHEHDARPAQVADHAPGAVFDHRAHGHVHVRVIGTLAVAVLVVALLAGGRPQLDGHVPQPGHVLGRPEHDVATVTAVAAVRARVLVAEQLHERHATVAAPTAGRADRLHVHQVLGRRPVGFFLAARPPPRRQPLRNTVGAGAVGAGTAGVGDVGAAAGSAGDEAAACNGRTRTRRPLGDRSGTTTTSRSLPLTTTGFF